MRALAAVAWLVVACGNPAKSSPPAAPGNPSAPPAATAQHAQPPVITAEEFCTRFVAIPDCPWVKNIVADRQQCVEVFAQKGDEVAARQVLDRFGPCVRDHATCEDVSKCFSEASSSKELRGCDEHVAEAAVGMPRAAWEKRKGAGVTHFVDALSTKAEPIKVCGIPAENDWLMATACNDGSHPFTDRHEAEAARVRNVGPGGRCHSIIDLYRVHCPEATYDIYLDGYVCPLPK
jgi:hypothetical protein